QRIVDYRDKIGGFISLEQLIEVKGIGVKTLARNRDKLSYSKSRQIISTAVPSVDLSPKVEKKSVHSHYFFWDIVIIIPLFFVWLFIFVTAWRKNRKKDKAVLRKHYLSTTFICSSCGKMGAFKNIPYEGHLSSQYVDGDLPPGWSCIPNYLGQACDYCFDCSMH
ncbi:MAG: helix-hairpin-helix domain-containing protein, partial [Thiomargarita sp.]|nr:helix-hairpin-helix domain-containing protein [Thiomargarita sp.]